VLLARIILRERPQAMGYAVIGLSLAGALVMLWPEGGGMPLPAHVPEWIGLSAGMAFAVANVLSRHARHHSVPAKSLAIWIGVALLCLVPVLAGAVPVARLGTLGGGTWGLLIGVGTLLFAVNLAVQYGLAHTPANRAIVIFLSELVVAAVSAYFLANETMSAREWLGGGMIVAASVFSGRIEAPGTVEESDGA
jgi:drug/metabolite transporter (DMT)-like permease